jgi:hypothetical protein
MPPEKYSNPNQKVRFLVRKSSVSLDKEFSISLQRFEYLVTRSPVSPGEKCGFSSGKVQYLAAKSAVSRREKCGFSSRGVQYLFFRKSGIRPLLDLEVYRFTYYSEKRLTQFFIIPEKDLYRFKAYKEFFLNPDDC